MQMKTSFDITSQSENGVLMGDFNFGDGDENSEIPKEYSDVYREIFPENSPNLVDRLGYTFDYTTVKNEDFLLDSK
jgi:hypothetical protein